MGRRIVQGVVLFWVLGFAQFAHAQFSDLNAAVLPSSRAVATGELATFFAVISNNGTSGVTDCRVGLSASAPAGMSVGFQTTDANNQLTGTTDTSAAIGAGLSQNYLVRVSSTAAFNGKAPLSFDCDETSAFSFGAVNQPDIRITDAAGPDIIAIGSSITNDGIVNVDLGNRLGAMSIAAINIGSATATSASGNGTSKPTANEAPITVAGKLTDFALTNGYQVFICETDVNAACLADLALSVVANIGDGGSTFSAFIVKPDDPNTGVPFIPNYLRLKVTFKDENGNLVGSTSAALNSVAPPNASEKPVGIWELIARDVSDPSGSFERRGYIVVPPDSGNVEGALMREDFSTTPSKLIPTPIRIEGTFDTEMQTLVGTMSFVGKGSVPSASASVALSYVNGQSMSISYDNTAAADLPLSGKTGGPAKPLINPLTSRGTFSAFQVHEALDMSLIESLEDVFGDENQATTRAGNEWTVSYSSSDFLNSDVGAVANIKGTVENCDLDMDVLPSMGTDQQAVLFGNLINCLENSPLGDQFSGSFSGPLGVFAFFAVLEELQQSDPVLFAKIDGLFGKVNTAIFSDGFESGDTTAWSDSIP